MDSSRAVSISDIRLMIMHFLNSEDDAWKFSFDLEDTICDYYEQLMEEDKAIAEELNENFPSICAECELGEDPEPFRQKIRKEYERIFGK